MRKYYIDKIDLINFVYKKYVQGNVNILRILGFTTKYVKGKKYKDFIFILSYLEPILNKDFSNLISDFSKKSKKKYISSKIYLEDEGKMKSLFDNIDPSILPPFTGVLKEMQNLTLEFASQIMSDIEQNTDIQVWMDGGTLLGAVRHKGFIPWDDDMDFACMRKDLFRLIDYMKSKYIFVDTSKWGRRDFANFIEIEAKKYKNQIFVLRTYDAFKCIKVLEDKFLIIDFFAFDYYNDYHNVETIQNYANRIRPLIKKAANCSEVFKLYDNEINKHKDIVEYSDVIQMGIDNHGFYSYTFKGIIRNNDIFPLKKLVFDNKSFNAPNNPHVYLKSIYNFYQKLPIEYISVPSHANMKNFDFTNN